MHTIIPDAATCLNAHQGNSIVDPDYTTYVPDVADAIRAREGTSLDPNGDPQNLLPQVVGALSDGAHCGGGLNGQDAYSGRIIPWSFNWQNGGGYGDANEGLGITEDGVGPLSRSQVQAVAYGIDEEQNATEDFFGTLKAREKGGGFEGAVAFKTGNSAKARSLGESEHVSPTLGAAAGGNTTPAVAVAENQRGELRESDCTDSLKGTGGKPGQGYQAVRDGFSVRRLTPRECERLQGFPDGYTNIPGASDSGRYKALGNSMAVPVMRWIGERIDKVSRSR
jgi:DNA (cytosine-5)-methyltransferase 1